MGDSIDAMDLGGDLPTAEPGVERPAEQLAWQLRWQSLACARMGSPLYAALLARAADDVEAGGPCWEVLRGHVLPARGHALALRFMAAVHRLALTGRAAALAAHYPSAGGTADPDHPDAAWRAFRDTVAEHAASLAVDVGEPCQTNEVGRAAGLIFGFLEVAAAGLPLRLFEVGASAGLNLRWDRFRYGGGGGAWGPPDSPVDLTGHWAQPPPRPDTAARVVERRGCDPHPVDPTTEHGQLLVRSSVWADQTARLARLDGALRLAEEVPAEVTRASADDWVAEVLEPQEGTAAVVFQSVVDEYLSDDVRRRLDEAVRRAGERATPAATVAWVRLEPATRLRSHAVTLTSWPGGDERLVAVCGAHGTDARRA